jgi:hypothetical protein
MDILIKNIYKIALTYGVRRALFMDMGSAVREWLDVLEFVDKYRTY